MGDLRKKPVPAEISRSVVDANFWVPDGTLRVKSPSTLTGAFFARDLRIDSRVEITEDNGL